MLASAAPGQTPSTAPPATPPAVPPGSPPVVPSPTPPADSAPPPAATPPPVLVPPPTTPEPTTPDAAQPSGRIAHITTKGNVNINTDSILAYVKEKAGDLYSQTAAEQDRDTIKNTGYFNGEVGLTAVNDPAGGVDVTFTVVENPVIKKIVFVANTPNHEPSVPADTLRSQMQVKEGQVLNVNAIVRDYDVLFNSPTSYMRGQGFIVDVGADTNIDPLTGVLTISLIEAHVDHIQVRGNKKTKSKVILREMHLQPGDVFNEKTLNKDTTRVYNLGLFDQVGPAEYSSADIGLIDVIIPVTEKRSAQVTVGVGYSSRSKLVGRASLSDNNLRGLGERISLSWEVGSVNSASSVDLAYSEPYLDKHHTSLDVDLYDHTIYRFASSTFGGTVGNDNTYTEQRRGVTLGLNRPLGDTYSAGVSVRLESVHTNDVELQNQDTFIRQDGTVTAVGARAANDTKDNDFNPATGGLRVLSFEVGAATTTTVNNAPTPLKPGDHPLLKAGADFRQYISLDGPRKPGDQTSAKKVVAVRLLLGSSNRDLPFFEQYFLGGPDSLRGFQIDRFWGNNLALFQGELRIPIGKGDAFQGVLFTDVGDSWGSLYTAPGLSQHQNFSPSVDYGPGVRLNTPIGLVRLDYGIPLNGGGSGRTQFSIGQSF